jgi:hypothetical protein
MLRNSVAEDQELFEMRGFGLLAQDVVDGG